MISELSLRAKPSNKKATAYAIGSLGGALICFIGSLFMDSFRWAPQLSAMILVVAGLVLLTRYVTPKFYYDVTVDSDGSPLFVVRQNIGKRKTTLCRIFLADIQKIEAESAEQRRAHKTPIGYVKYVYVPTFLPEDTFRITTVSRYERAEIIIECSEEFARLLSDHAAEARALRATEEEI